MTLKSSLFECFASLGQPPFPAPASDGVSSETPLPSGAQPIPRSDVL